MAPFSGTLAFSSSLPLPLPQPPSARPPSPAGASLKVTIDKASALASSKEVAPAKTLALATPDDQWRRESTTSETKGKSRSSGVTFRPRFEVPSTPKSKVRRSAANGMPNLLNERTASGKTSGETPRSVAQGDDGTNVTSTQVLSKERTVSGKTSAETPRSAAKGDDGANIRGKHIVSKERTVSGKRSRETPRSAAKGDDGANVRGKQILSKEKTSFGKSCAETNARTRLADVGDSAKERDVTSPRSAGQVRPSSNTTLGEVEEKSTGSWLDRNEDGHIDIEDLIWNQVSECTAQEVSAMRSVVSGQCFPWFMIAEILVTVSLWIVFAYSDSVRQHTSFWTARGGLDVMFEGQTSLAIANGNCDDLRLEVWRWFTYQFTHVGVAHIGTNTFLNLVLGLPLEAMHGWWRMAIMYNVGIFGGACCYFIADSHATVVGCSGGCYALVGIHIADLIMNWSQKMFRLPVIIMILTLIVLEVVSHVLLSAEWASNATHFGGAVAGLCIGVLVCENRVVKAHERIIMRIMLILGVALILFSLTWMAVQGTGPLNVFESMEGHEGWCWVRMTLDSRINPNDFECIRCGTKSCIDSFESYEYMAVSIEHCNAKGYWHE